MYRIKVMDYMMPNTYRWYNSAAEADRVARTIIKNKDAETVIVENLKEKKVLAVYQLGQF